jgi:hypothetical protein
MPHVSIRRYQIKWVPSVIAAHTRVQIGPNETYFANDNSFPALVPVSRSQKLVDSVELGYVDGDRALAVLATVDAHFRPGTYHVLFKNCVVYSYVLACGLFGEELVTAKFPTDANQLVHAARGWGDFLRPIRPPRWQAEWPAMVGRARLRWALEVVAEAAVPHG